MESEGAKILLYFQGLGARKAIITVKVKGHKRRLNSQSQTYGKRLEGTKSFLTNAPAPYETGTYLATIKKSGPV